MQWRLIVERVLIIEDDTALARNISIMLTRLGCRADTAEDGIEGLQAFSDALQDGDPYQIVFCDIMMPRMDGHKTITAIREIERKAAVSPRDETHIVMISALDDPKNVIDAMYKGGAYAYLPKPFGVHEIKQEVMRVRQLRSDTQLRSNPVCRPSDTKGR